MSEARPLYIQVSAALSRAIESDRYAVGSLLPTEAELCREFSVSRHTIREAIRHLKGKGILSARKRVGTRVESKQTSDQYTQSLHSIPEIFQYAQETRLQVLRVHRVIARGQLSEQLGCRPGKIWVHLETVRRILGRGLPICWTDIYIDRAYAGVARNIGVEQIAVYAQIERRYGETIAEVQQDIHAAEVSASQADVLHVRVGSPALLIVRRYIGTGGRILEISRSIHPADRFFYSMRLKRSP